MTAVRIIGIMVIVAGALGSGSFFRFQLCFLEDESVNGYHSVHTGERQMSRRFYEGFF